VNIPDILKGLVLDAWYKVSVYLGGAVLAASFFFEVKGITNAQLQLLAGGVFLLGLGEWKNHKRESSIQPPHASTGGQAILWEGTIRKPDAFGVLLDLLGLALIGLAVWYIVRFPA